MTSTASLTGTPLRLTHGDSRTLGARVDAGGVNFALAAPHAQRVQLCLFSEDGSQSLGQFDLPALTAGIWHGFLPGAGAGLVYGYRVHGPWAPHQGHRFNPAKLLLDPAARSVLGVYQGQALHCGHRADDPLQPDAQDNASVALKARVEADLPPVVPIAQPVVPAQRVIYELHVKGFTALHPGVPAALRGSYAGLAHPAAIAHLQRLGVTTLSLMPVAFRADEQRLQALGLRNYWGYSPVAWSAPENRYWSGTPGTSPRTELRSMVAALHAAGIEVVLDVVYNHTGETDEWGPTLSLRGIDNTTYYHVEPGNPAAYINWTGCGNCVNLNHPLVLRTVMDSLRNWVADYGVDGFRFDLAPVLGRGGPATDYRFLSSAPFLMAVAQDPVLRDCLMIAEPWDIGPGGYQLGGFGPGWLEWNDRFRDVQRGFWLHRQNDLGGLAQRIAGSTDCFAPSSRAPHASVNFVSAHDGFTLADLVSYEQRHNLANGEHNRDGHGHNLSVNHGVEGPSTDPTVLALRRRDRRTLMAMTLLSLGTPMLLAGDDIGHSQQGNNNAYCQDNAMTWLNWSAADTAMVDFVARLIAMRRARPVLQTSAWWTPARAQWLAADGTPLNGEQWHAPHRRAMQLWLQGAGADCLLLLNGGGEAQPFQLPPGDWFAHIDTATVQQPATLSGPLDPLVSVAAGSLWVISRSPLQ